MAGQLHPRIADHVDHIVQAYQRQGTDIRSENAANGGVDFIHAERQLVVREEYLPQVQAVLQRSALAGANNPPPTVEPVTRGIVLLRFEPTADRFKPTATRFGTTARRSETRARHFLPSSRCS